MRMHIRRFTRLRNAFSKRLENHIATIALYFVCYNFVRVHKTLRVTPAMAAGLSDHVWEVTDVVALLDAGRAVKRVEASERAAIRMVQPLGSTTPARGSGDNSFFVKPLQCPHVMRLGALAETLSANYGALDLSFEIV